MKKCIDFSWDKLRAGISMKASINRTKGIVSYYTSVLQYIIKTTNIESTDRFIDAVIKTVTATDISEVDTNVAELMNKVNAKIQLKKEYQSDLLLPTSIRNAVLKATEDIAAKKVSSESSSTTQEVKVSPKGRVKTSDPISAEGGDTGVSPEEGVEERELKFGLSDILVKKGTKSMMKITESYLGDNLISKPHLMFNLFNELIARNWLSTSANHSLESEFVAEDVTKKIKDDAAQIISSYYFDAADAKAVAQNTLGKDVELLFFDSTDRLPYDVDPLTDRFHPTGEIGEGDYKASLYYSKTISNRNVIFVVTNKIANIANRNELLIPALNGHGYSINVGDIVGNESVITKEHNLKPPRIDKLSADKHHNNSRITTAYFAHIILNHTDAFVDTLAQELNTTYKEYKRNGPVEIDELGIKGSSRMLTLGISSTRRLKAKALNSNFITKLTNAKSIMANGSFAANLNADGFIESINANRDKLFSINDGADRTGLLLNIMDGVYYTIVYNNDAGIWEFPISVNGKTIYARNYKDINNVLESSESIDHDVKKVLITLLDVFNNTDINDFKSNINTDIEVLDSASYNSFVNKFNNKRNLIIPRKILTLGYVDIENKYLTAKNILMSVEMLQKMPRSYEDAMEYLEEHMDEDSLAGDVARSLYYKYFKIGSYQIIDINPTTGKLEITEHRSIYDKYMKEDSKLGFNAYISMLSHLTSMVKDDKIRLENGVLVKSDIDKSNDLNGVIDSINTNMMTVLETGKMVYTNSAVKKKFKVRSLGGDKYNIEYYTTDATQKNSLPSMTFRFNGDVFLGITNKEDFTLYDIKDIGAVLGFPATVLSDKFYNIFVKKAKELENGQQLVDSFYANLIALKLANSYNNGKYTFNNIKLNSKSTNNYVEFKFEDNNINYLTRDLLNDTLKELSLLNSTTMVDGVEQGKTHEGVVLRNLDKDKVNVIDNIIKKANELKSTYLFKNSSFIRGELMKLMDNGVSKLGIKVGDTGKSNKDLSAKDQVTFQMSAFFQGANKAFTEAYIQDGPKSDRTNIQMFKVALQNGLSMIPKVDGKLDEHTLRDRFSTVQHRSLSALNDHIVLSWTSVLNKIKSGEIVLNSINKEAINRLKVSNIKTAKDVYDVLKDLKIDFNEALHKTGLVENITIFKTADGKAGLNTSTLQLIALFTTDQQHNEISENIVKDIKNIIIKNNIEIYDIDPITNKKKILNPNKIVAVTPGLFTKYDVVDEDGNSYELPNKAADIYTKTSVESNAHKEITDTRNFFMDMYYSDFEHYLDSVGFELSNKDVKVILDNFEYINEKFTNTAAKYDEALRVAKKIFFYNNSMFEHELMQFGMGTLFQYKTKEKSRLEKQILKATDAMINGVESHNKIMANFIRSVKMLKLTNGKTIMSLTKEEISKMKDGNYWSFVRNVLDSPMSVIDKARMLQYHDIFTQLTPMYVDRVKRNQGPGTSGHYMVLAEDGKAGHLMPKKSKKITVRNLLKEIRTITNAKEILEVFDGGEIVSPDYLYKHNNSLGGSFSNYSSKGGPIKTVNVSQNDDGVARYEKLAGFNILNYEYLMYAGPELNAINEFMMDHEKFSDYDTEYNGLYLPAKEDLHSKKKPKYKTFIVNSNVEGLDIYNFKKHGEYLGKVQVVYTNKSGEEVTEEMSSRYLMHLLRTGQLENADIKSVATPKVFIDSSIINSKLDLYNYYGGIDGNITALNMNKTDADKEAFRRVYPFGWVEHEIGYLMSNYAGSDGSYNLRYAQIDTIITTTATKTGTTNVNPAEAVYDRNYNKDDITVHEVSNKHLNNVLDIDHDFDISGSLNITAEQEDTNITMMTQVMSSMVSEGKTTNLATHLNNAIANLTNAQLNLLESEIAAFESKITANTNDSAEKQYSVDLVKKAIKTRKDPGVTEGLLGDTEEDAAKVSFDIKMLLPLLRTTVNSEFGKRGIKLKFPGLQYGLAPASEFMKTYRIKGHSLLRNTVNNKNNANTVFKAELVDSQKTYDKVPDEVLGWKLTGVLDIDTIRREHSPMDYIYKRVKLNNGAFKFEAIRVSNLLRDYKANPEAVKADLANSGYFTPWMSEADKQGEDLQWYNYFKNGKSLFDYEIYISFLASGEAPAELRKLNSLEEKIAFFSKYRLQSEESINGIPLNLAAQFLLQNEVHGKAAFGDGYNTLQLTPIVGAATLDATKAYMNNNFDSISGEFITWLESFHNKGAALSNTLRTQLKAELETGHWEMREAEFYLPPQYQSTQLIKYGDQPSDVWGTQEQPDLHRLTSITRRNSKGSIVPILSKEEKLVLETSYPAPAFDVILKLESLRDSCKECAAYLDARSNISLDKRVDAKILEDVTNKDENGNRVNILTEQEILRLRAADIYDKLIKLENEGCEYCGTYLNQRKEQQMHMVLYFEKSIANLNNSFIKKLNKEGSLSDKDISVLSRRSPILLLNVYKNSTELSNIIDDLLNKGSILKDDYLVNLLLSIQTAKSTKEKNKIITEAYNIFSTTWAENLANNFEKSLTFITARIPSQGPQFTTVGKIKAFVYSTRNSIYAPNELFVLNGGDYDIDKQNNITWNLDAQGRILRFKTDAEGELAIDSYIEQFTIEREILKQKLLDSDKYSDEEINKLLLEKEKEDNEYIAKVTQNYILHKVIETLSHPANFLESAVVTSLNKLGKIKDYLAVYDFSKVDEEKFELQSWNEKTADGKVVRRYKPNKELMKALSQRKLAIPFSPTTKMFYEKINMDGKMGIAIYASALKAYYAAYYAAVTNDGVKEYIDKVKKELKSTLNIKSGSETVIAKAKDTEKLHNNLMTKDIKEKMKYVQIYDKDTKNPIRYVWKDPDTGLYQEKYISAIANTGHTAPELSTSKKSKVLGSLHYAEAKEAFKLLLHAQSVEDEVNIVSSFIAQFNDFEKFNSESQVWEDLSELLTAATDNAKELILGIIGSNNDTANMISAMIMVGIDLREALLLINDPIIQDAIKSIDGQSNLTGTGTTDVKEYFTGILDKQQRKYKQTLTDEQQNELRNNIRENLIANGETENIEEKVITELVRQESLHKSYNPANQLLLFSKGARELTLLARILKINTDLVNDELGTFNYITMVESALGYYKKEGKRKKFIHVSLEEFVNMDRRQLKGIFDAYEKNKTFINIPYVIASNPHFFNYLKTVVQANKLVRSQSFIVDIAHSILKNDLRENYIRRTSFTYNEFSAFQRLLQDLAIDSYYKDNGIKAVMPDGSVYNLTDKNSREDFIKNVPYAVEEAMNNDQSLKNNTALKHIITPRLVRDESNNTTLRLFTGVNTHILHPGEIAGMKASIQSLKRSNPAVYNTLFNYSIIVDRAGLGYNSIASLFDENDYSVYTEHLLKLKNSRSMHDRFSNMNILVKQAMLPMFVKEISTKTGDKNESKFTKKKKTTGFDEYFDVDDTMMMQQDPYSMNDDLISEYDNLFGEERKKSFMNSLASRYDTSNIDAIRKSPDKYFVSDILRSTTNGLTYKWLEGNITVDGITRKFRKYVPIVPTISSKISGISYDEVISTKSKTNINAVSYDYGYEVVVPTINAPHVRVVARYGNSGSKYVVIARNSNSENDYRFHVVTKQELELNNPKLLLSGNAILIRRDGYRTKKQSVIYYNKESGKILNMMDIKNGKSIRYDTNSTRTLNSDAFITPEYRIDKTSIKSKIKKKTSKAAIRLDKFTDDYKDTINILFANAGALFKVYLTDTEEISNKNDLQNLFNISFSDIYNNVENELDDITKKLMELKFSMIEVGDDLMYGFMRLSMKDKITFIAKNINIDNINLSDIESLIDKVKITAATLKTAELSRSMTKSYLDNMSVLEGNRLLKADIDFLTKDFYTNSKLNIGMYLNILNKTGISLKDYMNKLNIGIYIKNEINASYLTINDRAINKVKIDTNKILNIKNMKMPINLGSNISSAFYSAAKSIIPNNIGTTTSYDISINTGEDITTPTVYDSKGKLFIVRDKLILDTKIYDLLPLYVSDIKLNNTSLYGKIRSEMVNDIGSEITDKNIADRLKTIIVVGEMSNTDTKIMELIGKESDIQYHSINESFIKLLSELTGSNLSDVIVSPEDSIKDIFTKIGMNKLFTGTSALSKLSNDEKSFVAYELGVKSLTEKEILKILEDNNYIKKNCK